MSDIGHRRVEAESLLLERGTSPHCFVTTQPHKHINSFNMLPFKPCPKSSQAVLDKARPASETVPMVKRTVDECGESVLTHTERIDTGRLGIPVYLSYCGEMAREIMPTAKQMGKGPTSDQAEASALMELVERYSLFRFWQDESRFEQMTWSEARNHFGNRLIPVEEMLQSVNETISPEQAEEVLDLVRWRFCSAWHIDRQSEFVLPMDWFKKLNEFNGSSAGNTVEEAVLQGGCELIERHVSALADRDRPALPTLDPNSFDDPVLLDLWRSFTEQGIRVLLKDFSMGMGVPSVGALAYDPSTFPGLSEIVLTAGTATSPDKAAIRALTEVAQLAGDFHTGSCYDPSGLDKPGSLEECEWLRRGETVSLQDLPDISDTDIGREALRLADRLRQRGYSLYSVDTTHAGLGIPATYNIAPGLLFRERAPEASLGLFVGRILAEEHPTGSASRGLDRLEEIYPGAHFLPFFRGLLSLRREDPGEALEWFRSAEPLQPTEESKSLAAFYSGYSLGLRDEWEASLPHLDRAAEYSPSNHTFRNQRGVAFFRTGRYQEAAREFSAALEIDAGSAVDMANLGLCYKNMGKPGAAMDFLQTALEMDPTLDFARNQLRDLSSDSE